MHGKHENGRKQEAECKEINGKWKEHKRKIKENAKKMKEH